MAPKDNDLEPIKDRKIVERYLRYALDFREQVSCLVEPGPLRFEAFFKSFNPDTLSVEMDITEASFELLGRAELNRLEALPKEVRLSFTINDVLYFFHARLNVRKTRHLELVIDIPIFKLQRRNAVRIKVLDSHNAKIDIGGKSYIPHDFSATGLSFMVMADQEEDFPRGHLFRSCRVRFTGLDVPVDLEVIGVTRQKKGNERLFKVGIKFIGMTAAVEQHIAKEAYLYTHKIWSRWL